MDRIVLKNGQTVELYCECDKGHVWREDMPMSKRGQYTVEGHLLPDGYRDFCRGCQKFKWSYIPIGEVKIWH